MPHKPDTPCAGCGKLLWRGPGSLPAGQRLCRECRRNPPEVEPQPGVEVSGPTWTPGAGLGPRGRALWREMGGATLDTARRVLLEEACRLSDRLDRLDALLCGDEGTWMSLRARDDDGSIVEVVVDKALSEARQQASTLKTLLAELRTTNEVPKQEASRRDELARRREERRRAQGL
jgi:hypothetical protein